MDGSTKTGWALVTGASSGLGADFARQLAARGYDVILTARRKDRLEDLAAEIRAEHGCRAEVISTDLAEEGAAAALYRQIAENGWPVEVLVNNAGIGQFGQFLARGTDEVARLIRLNVLALVELSHLVGAEMARRRDGFILMVGSLTAYQGTPWFATYGASKAFVLSFGQALHHELSRKGVTVTVLSPGITDTEFFDAAGHRLSRFQKNGMMDSATVVRQGLDALFGRRFIVVSGFRNRLAAHATRFVPRRWSTWAAGMISKGGPV